MAGGKVVLAYSGGLDTSIILHWLIARGYDVVTYTADLGQTDDYDKLRETATKVGASEIFIEDLRQEFVEDYVFPLLQSNAVYEGRYLLGTSIARPLTSRRQVEIAQKVGAEYVAHGATAKGNDQARFELVYRTLDPSLKVIAPWKDQEFIDQINGRSAAIRYAEQYGIPIKSTVEEPWSNDENLMHISYEAGELEDVSLRPRESMFERTVSPKDAPDEETHVEVEFENGIPIRLCNMGDGTEVSEPLDLFDYIDKVAGANGIGRVDIVENRFVGMKSRGVYETPGYTVLQAAHRDVEYLTMDREVMRLRDSLIPKFAELTYNGLWYSPEMDVLRALFDKSQEYVTGTVRLALYKGNIITLSRESPVSLYDQSLASMDEIGDYTPEDARGFVRVTALRLMNSARRKRIAEGK